MKKTLIFLFVVVFVFACFVFETPRDSGVQARETERSDFDEVLNKHSQQVVENGRQISRYDTLGNGDSRTNPQPQEFHH